MAVDKKRKELPAETEFPMELTSWWAIVGKLKSRDQWAKKLIAVSGGLFSCDASIGYTAVLDAFMKHVSDDGSWSTSLIPAWNETEESEASQRPPTKNVGKGLCASIGSYPIWKIQYMGYVLGAMVMLWGAYQCCIFVTDLRSICFAQARKVLSYVPFLTMLKFLDQHSITSHSADTVAMFVKDKGLPSLLLQVFTYAVKFRTTAITGGFSFLWCVYSLWW